VDEIIDPRKQLSKKWLVQIEEPPKIYEVVFRGASTQVLASYISWENMGQEENDNAHEKNRDDGEPEALQNKPFHISHECS